MHALRSFYPAWLAALAIALACGDPSPPSAGIAAAEENPPTSDREGPPGAQWDVVDMLRESRDVEFHPSDGGGRAWLEQVEPERPQVSSPARFTIVYEAGPLGVAEDGMIFLQVSPFWGWSTPQTFSPDASGFTEVTSEAEGVTLEAGTLDQQLLGIQVGGRALEAGERVKIVYGAGELGAITDSYAEKRERLWIAVDGDGDGVRKVLADSPSLEVRAGPPARLLVTLPTVGRPGETLRICIAILDAKGSRGVEVAGEVRLRDEAGVLELPEQIVLGPEDEGVKVVEARVLGPGVARLIAEGPDGLAAVSNPLVASAEGPRVLWGDLHGHSNSSDGTGTPQDYFLYARDVAGLDVAALTDHDHWGMLSLEDHPELWEEIRSLAQGFHEPGRFVTLLGYEWTSWIHGHRHVLYFGDEGAVYSSVDPRFESPLQLWAALEGQPALTFAHHSAGGPIPTNWEIPPDPRFEPVTEIVSVHGSSEALDSPSLIYSPVAGNFARDALDRGYRLGFVGSGDSHDGHPGLSELASPSGGLAAILSEERTREGVLEALRTRRVYATNGARILLRVALGAHPMGSSIDVPEGGSVSEELFSHIVAAAPLSRVDLIRSGAVIDGLDIEGELELILQRSLSELRAGEYVYLRVVQEDGGMAWSSPIFID
jgi:hypothetical protein